MKSAAQRRRTANINQYFKEMRADYWAKTAEISSVFSQMSRPPYKRLISMLDNSQNVHTREQLCYLLSCVHPNSQSFRDAEGVYVSFEYLRPHHPRLKKDYLPLKTLLRIFHNPGEADAVRAQALEGFGMINIPKHHSLRHAVENAILAGLNDESAEIRFWACYAATNISSGYVEYGLKRALPKLQEIVKNDKAMLEHWWYVAEEAADAIYTIAKRRNRSRNFVKNRKNKSLIMLYFEIKREKRVAARQHRQSIFAIQSAT